MQRGGPPRATGVWAHGLSVTSTRAGYQDKRGRFAFYMVGVFPAAWMEACITNLGSRAPTDTRVFMPRFARRHRIGTPYEGLALPKELTRMARLYAEGRHGTARAERGARLTPHTSESRAGKKTSSRTR